MPHPNMAYPEVEIEQQAPIEADCGVTEIRIFTDMREFILEPGKLLPCAYEVALKLS